MISLPEYLDSMQAIDTQAELAVFAFGYLRRSHEAVEDYANAKAQHQLSATMWDSGSTPRWPEGTSEWAKRFIMAGLCLQPVGSGGLLLTYRIPV